MDNYHQSELEYILKPRMWTLKDEMLQEAWRKEQKSEAI